MTPGASAALLLLAQGAPGAGGGLATPDAFPGPAPFGPLEWAGAALYAALFLAGLRATWLLVRDAPGAGEGGE